MWNAGGWVTINGAGATFSGYEVHGEVDITADDVTVEGCLISYGGTGGIGVAIRNGLRPIIQNNNIGGTRALGGDDPDGSGRLQFAVKDVFGNSSGIVIRGNKCWDTANTFSVTTGLIEYNYVDNMGVVAATDHVDCIIADGAQDLTIHHNTLKNYNDQTSCVALYGQTGPTNNVEVSNNYLAGGGYVMYGGDQTEPGTNVHIIDNTVSAQFYANGGFFGVLAAFGSTDAGNEFTGNTWADGPNAGELIS